MDDNTGKGGDGSQQGPEEAFHIPNVLPGLASGAVVLFPGLMVPLASSDEAIVQAVIEAAASPSKMLALFAQKTDANGQPTSELYGVGTAANVLRMAPEGARAVQAGIQGVAPGHRRVKEQDKPSHRVRGGDARDGPSA
jgi:ATP-dependent Lon protease